jgi:hypothetical protein
VTVDTQDDDVPVLVDHVLSAQNSYVVLVSDGVRWVEVASSQAAIKTITTSGGGATQLLLHEQNVSAALPSSGDHTITLPAVAACIGRIYSVYVPSGTTGQVLVAAAAGLSTVTLTAADDHLVVLSDGVRFYSLLDVST